MIDRIYILELYSITKRVEGNAGQILDEAPKNKPYNTVKTVFFSVFKLVIFSCKHSSVLVIFVSKMLNRIVLFFIFLGIFSASFAVGAEVQVSEEESAIVLEQFESLIGNIDAVGIFVHNVSLALPMFIPGFGIAWGAFAAFSTGMAFSVLQNANPILENIPSLTVLFMSPFGLMEVAAYSIAMSRSYMIVHKIIKRIPIRPDFRVIGLEMAILVGLLLTGGFVEYFFIESITTDMPKI